MSTPPEDPLRIVTFFSATVEWLAQGRSLASELMSVYPDAEVHALILPLPGDRRAASGDLHDAYALPQHLRLHMAGPGAHATISDPTAPRLIAVDNIKAALGRVTGLRDFWYVEADVSVFRAFAADQPFAGVLSAPVNRVSDPSIARMLAYLDVPESRQIDNGLMRIRDADTVMREYGRIRARVQDIPEAADLLRRMYVPGVALWSATMHALGPLLREDTATNWHAPQLIGRTDVLHNTGRSKDMRTRLRMGETSDGRYDVIIARGTL